MDKENSQLPEKPMRTIALITIPLFMVCTVLVGCPSPTGLVVEFDAYTRTGGIPLTVTFQNLTDQGGASDSSWQWSFGDGTTSEERNPTHIYTESGVFTVSLTVMNSAGTDTETKTDFIMVTEDPIASFSHDSTPAHAPLEVQFADTSSPGYPPINSWLWDFGDGTTSTEQNPSHIYTEAGRFDVSLTVATPLAQDQIVINSAVSVIPDIDYNTQVLRSPNSIDGKQILFTPRPEELPAGQFYERTIIATNLASLPVSPIGHQELDFSETFEVTINLTGENGIPFFGEDYHTIVIGADGTIAFGGSGNGNATLVEHFSSTQLSLMPVELTSGGTCTFFESEESVVVTFSGFVIGETIDNQMQVEFFLEPQRAGEIVISYPQVSTTAEGIVGLSNGPLVGATETEIEDFVNVFFDSDLGADSVASTKAAMR